MCVLVLGADLLLEASRPQRIRRAWRLELRLLRRWRSGSDALGLKSGISAGPAFQSVVALQQPRDVRLERIQLARTVDQGCRKFLIHGDVRIRSPRFAMRADDAFYTPATEAEF